MIENWSMKDLKGLIKNPLDFIFFYTFLSLLTFVTINFFKFDLTVAQEWTLLISLVVFFPFINFLLFAYLVIFHWGKLFSPEQRNKFEKPSLNEKKNKLKREVLEDREGLDKSTFENEQNLYQEHADVERKTLLYLEKILNNKIEKNSTTVYSSQGFSIEFDGIFETSNVETGIEIKYTKSGRILDNTIARLASIANKVQKIKMNYMIVIVSNQTLQQTTKNRLENALRSIPIVELKYLIVADINEANK